MKDPYVYEGTNILINKLNIKDPDKLTNAEADITATKLISIDSLLKDNTKFNFEYLKNLHKHIFNEIYPFAGQVRSIPIEKSEDVLGGDTVRYATPDCIEKKAVEILDKWNTTDWKRLNLDQKSEQLSKFTAALWQIHPFREGNTRTVMTFSTQFATAHGFSMDRKLLAENSTYVRKALVKASDGQYSEYEYLNRIIKDSMILEYEKDIHKVIIAAGFRPTPKLISDMKKVNEVFGKFIRISELRELVVKERNTSNVLSKSESKIVNEAVKDFAEQEKINKRTRSNSGPELEF